MLPTIRTTGRTSGISRTRSKASRIKSRASRKDEISICLPGRRDICLRDIRLRDIRLRDAYEMYIYKMHICKIRNCRLCLKNKVLKEKWQVINHYYTYLNHFVKLIKMARPS
jgi:hypothetical protein